MTNDNGKPYLVLISIHGLIRGQNLELGRDADTGGQTKYVVELARALGEHPAVGQVDLVTRRVIDPAVSDDYAQPIEPLSANTRIVRIDCGEEAYIPKEQLWDSLDSFADNLIHFIKQQPRRPALIHSHYADAGYVGTRISSLLGVPLAHTGHSLGRSKRRQLLAAGHSKEALEARYNITRRIEAEETTLGVAERVITSTHQEINEQYALYDHYQPERMRVVPPGTDLQQFYPPTGDEFHTNIAAEVARFLQDPGKPMILALSRPDPRKNIAQLVSAYGESPELQQLANLVIIAGNRDDIREMDTGAQEVLQEILLHVDQYDLYGKVAYPKHHQPTEVPTLYRLAAFSQGVFINPALTEPFGLTLIEAAASGLPIVATEDGGPTDIIGNCHNGHLVNPLDNADITDKLLRVLTAAGQWQTLAANGLQGVKQHYSWQAHVEKYLEATRPLLEQAQASPPIPARRRKQLHHDRALFSDLDQNLLGRPESLTPFIQALQANRKCVLFGIATGRRLDSAMQLLKKHRIPPPDVLITSLGTEIYYAPNLLPDSAWELHIDHLWNPRIIRRTLSGLPGLKLQPNNEQSRFKVSYFIDPQIAPDLQHINKLLHQEGQAVNVMLSFGQYLDIIPVRASKGLALRWFADKRDIPLERVLAAGGSGADEDMIRGNTLAVVVANRHHEELSELALANAEGIFFATRPYAEGILEAIEHYHFFQACEVAAP
ncbi:HAD-IIB family hydrolase [Candidatus Thiothrix sp. Deng01]|uniref:sucrose-phosphate synthase n=1 Tax=Candidatus Thiothrix phosphatis TaxID=3112415 RepID=A0ABU6D0G4_9GAMM|nr:HAD-IIB family hydrolase [Candidatus Thiothrix sp. Deng01]MEB4591828.1 HAD-IIB family hydrolase [Candidatus Thiothrix sp. Deng01]